MMALVHVVCMVLAVAQLGIEIPSLGGGNWWSVTFKKYVTPAIMQDIRNNLHATYVRTGWIPDRLRFENFRWRREDSGMDIICNSGLHVMMIVPSPKDDHKGMDDLVSNVREFFARYSARNPGCIRYAELGNEADLAENEFANVDAYAAYYRTMAPVVAAFGIPVITSGVSGEDRPWTSALSEILGAAVPSVPVAGYGFHPYGVPPADMAGAVMAMRTTAAGALARSALPAIYVTEIGQARAADLYDTIVNLAPVTPAITIYEYQAQSGEDPQYGLKNNPALYEAVRSAWSYVQRTTLPAITSPPPKPISKMR